VKALAVATLLVLALAGCPAGTTSAQIADKAIAVGGDALTCAPAEYNDVQDAIAHGGVSWVAVALQAFQCIASVVRDLEAKQAELELFDPIGYMVADEAGELAPPPDKRLSRGARRRLAAAKVLGQLVSHAVKP
jgi:hypothetical protein